MSKHHLIAGMAIVLLGLGMCAAGSTSAAPPLPQTSCDTENEGAYKMTDEYSTEYVEYATYVCTDSAWALLDISRCYYSNGRCVPR